MKITIYNIVLATILSMLILAYIIYFIDSNERDIYIEEKMAYIQYSNNCFMEKVNISISTFRLISRQDICDCLLLQEAYLQNKTTLFNDFKKDIAIAKEANCNKTMFNIVVNNTK